MAKFCDQETVNSGPCMNKATWWRIERDGRREFYCTRHANHYGVPRRNGVRIVKKAKG